MGSFQSTTSCALLAIEIHAFMEDFPDVAVKTWQPELDEICVWGTIPAKYITKVEVNKYHGKSD